MVVATAMASSSFLRNRLNGVQSYLNFDHCRGHPLFATPKGIGRVGVLGCILGIVWGFHFILCVVLALALNSLLPLSSLSPAFEIRLFPLLQWSAYIVALCTFHLSEFFVTVLYNPSEASADSYLVNHSTGYTAAALTSWLEFWVRFLCFPDRTFFNSSLLNLVGGLVGVVLSQMVRSVAMVTAGESFNHFIQVARKDNHVLVTHGIYRYLRHPSYVGFYYWSVSTQLLLGNYLHAVAFAIVSWLFFRRRIAYEEESLCKLFPDEYPQYVARSYTGIPFLYTQVDFQKKRD